MKIAYIMSRFPHLPETFILREMIELEKHGFEIALYPLLCQKAELTHVEAGNWLERAHCNPYLSVKMLSKNLKRLKVSPAEYFSLFSRVLKENIGSLNFFIRAIALFPKSVEMADEMLSEGVEHIHAHYATHPALAAWIIHRLTGIRYSVTVHAHDIYVRKQMLATKLQDATFIVAISKYNAAFLERELGEWITPKTYLVHCGINPALYSPRSNQPAQGAVFEMLNIGSLQPYKGQIHLIRACSILKERGVKFRCRIIGEGEERSRLEREISALRLKGYVELLGAKKQDEVAHLLPNADCYIQPSIITRNGKTEGIPVSIMEAMASGVPVIATSVSGVPELVHHSETGLLVTPSDPPSLAGAIQSLAVNREKAQKLASAGRELALSEFNLSDNVSQLAGLFRNSAAQPANLTQPFHLS